MHAANLPPQDPDSTEARGSAAMVVPPPPTSDHSTLDQRRILGAALRFIDEHGIDALTMRRLGAEVGVEAMALYRYVASREQMLDGVVESVVDELYGDPDVHMDATHGWQDYLHRLAHGVRRIALAHPAVFPLVATRPPSAPWIRPPLRSLRWVESFLGVMTSSGFSDEKAVAAYRGYTSFLLGHLLLEVSQRGVPISSRDEPNPVSGAAAHLEGYPTVVRLEEELSRDESAAEFDEALESLLDRLDRLLRESGHLRQR
jgi:AcrR family transcriptional regulator